VGNTHSNQNLHRFEQHLSSLAFRNQAGILFEVFIVVCQAGSHSQLTSVHSSALFKNEHRYGFGIFPALVMTATRRKLRHLSSSWWQCTPCYHFYYLPGTTLVSCREETHSLASSREPLTPSFCFVFPHTSALLFGKPENEPICKQSDCFK